MKRRQFLTQAAAAAALGLAALQPARTQPSTLIDLTLDDADLLDLFIKMRYSLDNRITIGWVDAVNYGFVEGETFPLYRLLAATWRKTWQPEPGRYRTRQIEVAFFLDIETGERLETLRMPLTNQVVEVPLYRAGPSEDDVEVRFSKERRFEMKDETRDGDSFFTGGSSISEGFISQPQRAGDDFFLRQDIDTRVFSAPGSPPSFFYREWTVTRASWAALQQEDLALVPCEVSYTATAAWRPWMQMQGQPGHTIQNGFGGRVVTADRLPADLQQLTAELQPDLIDDPQAALG